ncbi:hypothetical protein [Chryseobacterium indoltheticum]|uniref:Uncharacterized protein n=1 Tax=Chryseobacterium indoltheticum TaxID=254 RepID=A0A3G6N5L9_9FLAO|nr:hypothetical protein [Chryseobacterium indoltheticum]AZA60826.1 hypothetical protein EG340_07120 [Chryseobacterium indoltheticum]
MDIIKEENLDDFLSKLLLEEGGMDFSVFSRKYDFPLNKIDHYFNLINDKKDGWVKMTKTNIYIPQAFLPVVILFLQNGGFVAERNNSDFESRAKKANYDLVVKQTNEIKITRYISIGAIIISAAAFVLSIFAFNAK